MNQLPSNIEQEFREQIAKASYDHSDIEAAYENVITDFKLSYPAHADQIDALWIKMCQESEDEMNDYRSRAGLDQ